MSSEERRIEFRQVALELSKSFNFGKDGDDASRAVVGYPNGKQVISALEFLAESLFPGRTSPLEISEQELPGFIESRIEQGALLLLPELRKALALKLPATSSVAPESADSVLSALLQSLVGIRSMLIEDLKAAYAGDPAARSFAEILIAYPGFIAILTHRIAHELYQLQVPIIPRIMSEWVHAATGIDIHPGAKIGGGFFLDHGTGVVIGETAHIGERVKIYQGVTLGARSFTVDEQGNLVKGAQRHPSVQHDVVIYANATILGGDTVIGEGSVIGGNVFLTESVPARSTVMLEEKGLRIRTRL